MIFHKSGIMGQGRPEHGYVVEPRDRNHVTGVVRARTHRTNHDENVLEVRSHALRREGGCPRLLEDYCNHVVTYVTFPG